MAPVDELGVALQSLRQLKAPGVNKSKIEMITSLCIQNIESELSLVQKIFNHFKNTPPTHKLGVIYIVDSVTRQWIEKARQAGQDLSGMTPSPGTFAGGVHHMTQQVTTMMKDLIVSAPLEQKDKIRKLVDIWDRGNTFPANILSKIKTSFVNSNSQSITTTTILPDSQKASTAPQQPKNIHSGPPTTLNVVSESKPLLNTISSALTQEVPAHSTGASSNILTSTSAAVPQPSRTEHLPTGLAVQGQDQNALIAALASIIPAQVANNPQALTQQLQMLQGLAQAGIPQQQWGAVLAALGTAQAAPAPTYYPATQAAGSVIPASLQTSAPQNMYSNPPASSVPPAYSTGAYRQRSRSPIQRDGTHSYQRRGSPIYDTYGSSYIDYNSQRDKGRIELGSTGGYRQRSPMRTRDSPSYQADVMSSAGAPKWTEIDPTLPSGYFKVLSRTLFVGGTACAEHELRPIFARFGRVQTCIVNPERRHAFVKMLTRAEAVAAKTGMDNVTDSEVTSRVRSTRWGVGFGPQDCCDFTTGISTIPIDSLTDADRKWMHTAEHGGCGQIPLVTGLVVEEPDIEIGAGVSSKGKASEAFFTILPLLKGTLAAISKRANEGPGRRDGGGRRAGTQRLRDPQHRQSPPAETQNTIGVPPLVPGFGFQFPGMVVYPPH